MKYRIKNEQDYIAFLHGKILFAADAAGEYNAAVEFLRLHRSVSELETYLESL